MTALLRIGIIAVCAGLVFLFLSRLDQRKKDAAYYRSILQNELNGREERIRQFSADSGFHKILQEVREDKLFLGNGGTEASIINRLSPDRLILLVFREDQLKFWSSNQVVPEKPGLFPEGMSLATLKNGQYLVFRKTDGALNVLFLFELKSMFDLQNAYLQNEFVEAFHMPRGVEIAEKQSGNAADLFSLSHHYLFSIRLNQSILKKSDNWQCISGWTAFFILIYLLVSSTTRYFSENRKPFLAFVFAILAPLLLRYLMLRYKYPEDLYNLRLFNPVIYSSSFIFYSLGDFLINVLLLIWILYFLLRYSGLEQVRATRTTRGFSILSISTVCILLSFYLFELLFSGLVKDSSIPLDLVNVLSINYFTLLSFVLLALLWFCLYYVLRLLSGLVARTPVSSRQVGLLILFLALVFTFFQKGYSAQRFIPGFIAVLTWMIYLKEKKGIRSVWRPATLIFVLVISIVSALKLNAYIKLKENTNRLVFAEKLEKSSDPVSEFLLKDNEGKIASDSVLSAILQTPRGGQTSRLFRLANQRIQKTYFGRSFSNFDIQTFLYNSHDELISGRDVYPLSVFRSAAGDPGIRKVSTYFYQLRTIPPDYVGVIPVQLGSGKSSGTVVIRISTKYIGENNSFPELLMDVKTYFERRQEIYSYAYYMNESLLDKFGKFPYAISSRDFMPASKTQEVSYRSFGDFNHMVYNPSAGSEIVVSLPETNFFKQVAVFSYILAFYLVFFFFGALVFLLIRLFRKAGTVPSFIHYLSQQRILYKSRIQITVVSGVLISLFIVGWITLLYIQNQYEIQQKDLISSKIDNLRKAFENEMPTDSLSKQSESSNLSFLSLASEQNSDVNFFDTNGDLVYTSLAKLYDRSLISQKMNPFAFIQMYVSGRTELINQEQIGKLKFLSAYAPVRNSANQVVGYVNVPYFSNQNEIDQKISGFVSALINVYVFVFLLIGLIAFALANSITYPLALIQASLKRIKIGNVNEPLVWKRDDEIGDLIREYNSMVRALEESADKLARSERESAWREMARQVAHEIKNPLTPLKLGIQHLERSWKNQDPDFDEKFKRFSATFIQQIDSLSAIATEFSTFAQMPPANLQIFDIGEIISLSADLFREEDSIKIETSGLTDKGLFLRADRDQLQRALNNLLKNAIQAIPDNRKGLISISLEHDELEIRLKVCDNGSGIPEDIQDSIFSPNFTTKSSGMGLGLAFVKNAVENAEGSIRFDSEEGEGTCFIIVLPRALKEPDA